MQQLLVMMQKISAEPNNDAQPDNHLDTCPANDEPDVAPTQQGTDNHVKDADLLSDEESFRSEELSNTAINLPLEVALPEEAPLSEEVSSPAVESLADDSELTGEEQLPEDDGLPEESPDTDECTSPADEVADTETPPLDDLSSPVDAASRPEESIPAPAEIAFSGEVPLPSKEWVPSVGTPLSEEAISSDVESLRTEAESSDETRLPAEGGLPENASLSEEASSPEVESLPAETVIPDDALSPEDDALPEDNAAPEQATLSVEASLLEEESPSAGLPEAHEVSLSIQETSLSENPSAVEVNLPSTLIETTLDCEASDSTRTDIETAKSTDAQIVSDEHDEVTAKPSASQPAPSTEGFVRRWFKRAVSWIKRLIGY